MHFDNNKVVTHKRESKQQLLPAVNADIADFRYDCIYLCQCCVKLHLQTVPHNLYPYNTSYSLQQSTFKLC